MVDETIKPSQWATFFTCLSNANSISKSLRKAGISRATAYRYKNNDAAVAYRWREALASGDDYLKDVARARAVHGVTSIKQFFDKSGKVIAVEQTTKYSDGLLLALLRQRDPTFGDNTSERVQKLVAEELRQALDVLAQKLPVDLYAQVVEILATYKADVIDAIPTESSTSTLIEDQSANDDPDP